MKNGHLLVLGGSRGLGWVLANSAIDRYERISVVSRTVCETGSESVVQPSIYCYAADLLNITEIPTALEQICAEGGPVDALAFTQRYRGKDQEEEWRTTVCATKEIIEYFERISNSQRNRSIIVMNSIAGQSIVHEQPLNYHLQKAATEQLVRYYAVKLGPRGIRVNGITSGPYIKPEAEQEYRVNKPLRELHRLLSPLGRLPTAEEICRVILFLLSNDAIQINGQHLVVDGGICLQGHESVARRIADELGEINTND